MRVTLFLLVFSCLLGVILWLTLSGALFFFGLFLWFMLIVITISYADTCILFFLGAREIKSGDEEEFHSAAVQGAYKLAVPQPRLYFYNGALERAFVLHKGRNVSLVISKELLDVCSKDELAAICFELLIQVKKGLAWKRTRVMFVVGMFSWLFHTFISLIVKLVPLKEVKYSMNWFLHYMLQPWLEIFFKLTLGDKYFRRLDALMKEFPLELSLLNKVGSKIRYPSEIYSLSSRKMFEFTSVSRSRHYQNIITLEFLPHEWDSMFEAKAEARAQ